MIDLLDIDKHTCNRSVPHGRHLGQKVGVQVIARIHTTVQPVRRSIHALLVRIGRHHPQALMYPLLVACKSQSTFRRAAAMSVVDAWRQHSATLVEQAQLVSSDFFCMHNRAWTVLQALMVCS